MANIFVWLMMGHVVFDWLLQNDWMAMGKSKRLAPLVVHSLMYAIGVTVTAIMAVSTMKVVTHASLWFIFHVLFFTHVFLDNYKFHSWWKRSIKGMSEEADKATLWLTISIDQCWHILVLFYIALKMSGNI